MSKVEKTNRRPSNDPEIREAQLISYAIDLAEKQLIEGTASSQVITHYLKLGSTKEKLEKEILERQKDLLSAKTEQIKAAKNMEEMLTNAVNAMKQYRGDTDE